MTKKSISYENIILYSIFGILFIYALTKWCQIIEKYNQIPQYMNHKSKCYDCERDIINRLGKDQAWRAQPSKLFSTETAGIAQTGKISGGFLGKTMKYY